jgi:twitching motility protein PilT
MMVGEMRDLATIGSAITAAETGHLVFGTLHTSGAASTINRIIDAFPTDQQEQVRVQLANNLIAVLSQAICPRVDVEGMVAAFEFMYVTPSVQNLIRENKVFRIDSEIQTGKRYGMQLLDDTLWALYQAGKISAEEAIDKSKVPGQMIDKFTKAGIDTGKSAEEIALAEGASTGANSAAGKPKVPGAPGAPGASPETERNAKMEAARARMQAMAPKK